MQSRKKARKKRVALVLGAGGVRGFAHIGVINVLERNKIPIDLVVGTSMGALIGGLYAAGKLNDFRKELLSMSQKRIHKLFAPEPVHQSTLRMLLIMLSKVTEFHLVRESRVESFIKKFIKDKRIHSLDKEFIAIAADLISGKEILLSRGSLFKAIRASIALPGFFSSIKYGTWLLIDGGVIDHIPIRVAKKRARIVLAVSVYPGIEKLKSPAFPNLFQVMQRSLDMMEDTIINIGLEDADVIIKPRVSHISTFEFEKAKQAIRAGERAAKKALPKIKALVKYKSRL